MMKLEDLDRAAEFRASLLFLRQQRKVWEGGAGTAVLRPVLKTRDPSGEPPAEINLTSEDFLAVINLLITRVTEQLTKLGVHVEEPEQPSTIATLRAAAAE